MTTSITFIFGQFATEFISIEKGFGGNKFYQAGQRINVNQLVNTLELNEEAYRLIKSAKPTYTLATILGGAGGFMLGWPLGGVIAGGEPNWSLVGIGAGLIAISIPLADSFNKKANQAVRLFNSELPPRSYGKNKELKFSISDNRMGFHFSF